MSLKKYIIKNNTLKISDFCLAKFLKAKDTNSFIGAPAWNLEANADNLFGEHF